MHAVRQGLEVDARGAHGLGKFVWDEFQNGSSESLSRIMVAVITIGLIGFLLDRLMLSVQRLVSWDKNAVLR